MKAAEMVKSNTFGKVVLLASLVSVALPMRAVAETWSVFVRLCPDTSCQYMETQMDFRTPLSWVV